DNNGFGGPFPVDAAFNSDVTQGNLIVACIAAVLSIDADISIRDSEDNEYQQAITSNPVFPDSPADTTARMAVYYARAKASGPLTVTVDGSSFGTLSSINLYEATAPGALALDVTGSADTQYVYSKALAYVSTSAPAKSGDVVIAFFMADPPFNHE